MNKYPSSTSLVISFLILLVYLSFDFWSKANRDFFQLNYDWKKKDLLYNYGIVKVDSVSYDFLKISNIKADDPQFDNKYTYSIDNKHYFRYTSKTGEDNRISFKGVYWINTMPDASIKNTTINKYNLPLKQNGKKTVCMIGDSQFVWQEGKYTRKDIARKFPDIKFVGNNTDLFGYPYCAELLLNTTKIADSLTKIPYALKYILFIGAHENNVENIENNIKTILEHLLKNNSKVILVIPPHYKNESKLPIQKKIKEVYNYYNDNSKIQIIDLENNMANIIDICLMQDGIHLNFAGHKKLTEYLVKLLDDDN